MRFTVKNAKDKGLDNILKNLEDIESERIVPPKVSEKPKKEKKKKTKKKKKKDDEIELLSVDPEDSTGLEECEDPDLAKRMRLLDVDEIFNSRKEEEDELSGHIIGAQRGAYKRRKKDSNEYKKEFAEELTLLYDLLGDTSDLSKRLKNFIDLDKKTVGGVSKTMTEMVDNLIKAQTARLQILKEISAVKKSAIDLTLKAESKKNKETSAANDQQAISSLIHGIMKAGRDDFVRATRGPVGYLPQDTYDYGDEDDDSIGSYYNMLEYGPGMTGDEQEEMMDMIKERLENEGGGVFNRTDETDAYIRYESRNVEIKVRLYTDTGKWEFFAVDRDNIIIPDYPLPRKRDVEPMKFTGALAIDKRGVQYKVVEMYSDEMNE